MPFVIPSAPDTTQTLTFDPVSEDADNTPLELVDGDDIHLVAHSYPAPPQDIQKTSNVDMDGERIASRRYGNRTISLTVECGTYTALMALEAKVAKIARDGGTLKWVLPWSEEIVFDLLANPGYEPTFGEEFFSGVSTVSLQFEADPYGRGLPVTLSSYTTETSPTFYLPALVFTEAVIAGSAPALGRLEVTNDSGTALQRWWWGLQSVTYDAASTASLYYEAESLFPNDATAAVGSVGASGSGSNVLKNTALTTGYTDQFTLGSSPRLTHVGQFRVLARVYCPLANTGTVTAQFQWRSSGGGSVTNDPATYEQLWEGTWRILDLGYVNLVEGLDGVRQWFGTVQAKSTVAGDDVEFDSVMLIPVTEGAGEMLGATAAAASTVVTHEGAWRQIEAGWLEKGEYYGDHLFVPPSGDEARTLRLVVKTTSQIDGLASPGDDLLAVSGQLTITPRYLVVPTP